MTTSGSHPKILLTGGGIILAAAFLVFLVILPQLSRVAALRSDIGQGQKHLTEIADRIREFDSARVELQKIADERESVEILFPAREDMVSSVETVEAAAAAVGVTSKLTITDAREEPAAGKGAEKTKKPPLVAGLEQAEEVPFELELVSDYRGLVDFFRYLENSKILVRFAGLGTVAQSQQGETGTVPHNNGQATSKLGGVFFIRK